MSKYLNWSNYLRFLRAKGPAVVAPFLAKWERAKIERFGDLPLRHPPIFIVGPPRSGSTIFYQVLSNLFDVAYCTSLVDLLYRNFFFGFVLSNSLYGSGAHNILESSYGKAIEFSPRMPTEAGYLWGRWLPRDKHFMDANDISAQKKAEIRRDITSISNYLEKPIIFKTLVIGQRLRLFHDMFPEAKIIFLSREQAFTAQSILLGRTRFSIPNHKMWSIRPPNFEELERLEEIDMVAQQVFSINWQISRDIKLFDSNQVLRVSYESLAKLDDIMAQEWENFLKVRRRKNSELHVPEIRNKRNVDSETFNRIFEAVEKAGQSCTVPAKGQGSRSEILS